MLNKMMVETVENYPQKTAIVFGNLRINYKDLYGRICGFSNGLTSIGVSQSSCVAFVLPNCPEFVIGLYATARLHAVVLPLNPAFKEEEIKFCIKDTNTSTIITDMNRADRCAEIISQLGRPIKLIVVDGKHQSGESFYDLSDDQEKTNKTPSLWQGDVLYQYSSGSTGRPKRVCRTQKNLIHEAVNFTATTEITSSDNILCVVPMFHAHGLGNCLLAAIYNGATLVILEQHKQNGIAVDVPFLFKRPRVFELIEKEKISVLPGVPYIFGALADAPDSILTDLTSLQLCFSAGSPLPKRVFDKILNRFGIPVRQLYGCTEAGSISINLDNSRSKHNSVGQAMKNVAIKIIDENRKEMPPRITGEILIKSQALTNGYANMTEFNKEAFKDGYFCTGDLGWKDEEGHLYITGRKLKFINCGGNKVDPLEVEDVLNSHPKVEEAVVVGVEEPYQGEIVKAVIVPNQECGSDEIFSFCRKKLAEFKVPQIVEFRDQIPKNQLGKILRKDLI